MKKSKILLLAPVFALLVSCSKAPSTYDKVTKSVRQSQKQKIKALLY